MTIHTKSNDGCSDESIAIFEQYESQVRSYCRTFPFVINRAKGSYVYNIEGKRWLDFLCGAGSLNYGHNPPGLKNALMEYIAEDGIVSSLDFHTHAKERFLREFSKVILQPRGLNYKVQFCGPTGTNSVEAAIRLARKYTGRRDIISFSNSYHGMTAGAMSLSSSSRRSKAEDFHPPNWVNFLPFDGFTGLDNEIDFIRVLVAQPGSGYSFPAAFIVEIVQGEGGVNIASKSWIKEIYQLAKDLKALFIVDDIQVGCGRTGRFFSFEHFDIVPDIVCISKSISGYGLPMSILLIKPELDIWEPGEYIGTFRGFTHSFVTATETLKEYWEKQEFTENLCQTIDSFSHHLQKMQSIYSSSIEYINQLGMIAGIKFQTSNLAKSVQAQCFEDGLIVELCGLESTVLKLLPPLTVTINELADGMAILSTAIPGE